MAAVVAKKRRTNTSESAKYPVDVRCQPCRRVAGVLDAEPRASVVMAATTRNETEGYASDEEMKCKLEGRNPYSNLLHALRVPKMQNRPGLSSSRNASDAVGLKPQTIERQVDGHSDENEQDGNPNSENERSVDPFESHLSPAVQELSVRLKNILSDQWVTTITTSSIGRMTIQTPGLAGGVIVSNQCDADPRYVLKTKLQHPYKQIQHSFSRLNTSLGIHLASYRDLLYCGRNVGNAEGLRMIVCLHMLNHIIKTRDCILKDTARIARSSDIGENMQLRDQGFTRPKVLILLETRHSCARYVATLTQLFQPDQQENRNRFHEEFMQSDSQIEETLPPDFRELFEGNNDSEFRLGLKFGRKAMKFYSQFYNSDVIFASPLGLRRAIRAEDPKHMDYDFLSSIEIILIDQTDAMLMQNWEHVDFVLDLLNLQPKEAHGCDFSRVRQWYLDQNSRYFRQTIVFSSYITPEINSMFSIRMKNMEGRVKIIPEYTGATMNLGISVRQTFSRFNCESPLSDADDRFKFFTTFIIPLLDRHLPPEKGGLGALIFIPSYLDFVRVRNFFATSQTTKNLTFGSISEYTEQASSRRARSHFFTGRQSVMLYTGRAHHFHRYRIRGVKRVIMYGVPENVIFYTELVAGFIGATLEERVIAVDETSVIILFSKWDGFALERIVGSKRVGKLLEDRENDTFEFR